MTRKRSGLEQLRRDLYLTQRTLGDFQAAQRGPGVLTKRIVRRRVTRGVFASLRRAGLL